MPLQDHSLKIKLFSPYLFLFYGFFLSMGANREATPLENKKEAIGGIYGFLWIKTPHNKVNDLSPSAATIHIEGSELLVKPDSIGYFYFGDIKPGTYNLIGHVPGFADYFVENIEVRLDSISVLDEPITFSKYRSSQKKEWNGIKIEMGDVQRKGCISGKVI